MIGSVAVQRIKDGLGFLQSTSADSTILLRLNEAQRDLEKGKTLPKFLLQGEQTLLLTSGTHATNLPTGFIRVYDEERPRIVTATSDIPVFLSRKYYDSAVAANIREENDPVAPKVYVIRKSTIDFITTADTTYTLTWSYYKGAAAVESATENEWLANAAEWLIGFAGRRYAMDRRNKTAVELFSDMESRGRAAVFGEIIAAEEADGPMMMGADL